MESSAANQETGRSAIAGQRSIQFNYYWYGCKCTSYALGASTRTDDSEAVITDIQDGRDAERYRTG